MQTLKMVNGKTYIDARINKGEPVYLGNTVVIEDDLVAEDVKKQGFTDLKDNPRKYFKQVPAHLLPADVEADPEQIEEEEDVPDASPIDEAPKAPAAPRRSRASK
jgi:hypothetical protein